MITNLKTNRFDMSHMNEYPFLLPRVDGKFELFPSNLENDPHIFFHGTLKKNMGSIIQYGFKSFPPLSSVSYAKSSVYALTHLYNGKTKLSEEGIVFAVKFETLNKLGIANHTSGIHVYSLEIQPTIIGYCILPVSYQHI